MWLGGRGAAAELQRRQVWQREDVLHVLGSVFAEFGFVVQDPASDQSSQGAGTLKDVGIDGAVFMHRLRTTIKIIINDNV